MKMIKNELIRDRCILVTDFDGTLTVSGSSMNQAVKILGRESSFGRARNHLYEEYGWIRQETVSMAGHSMSELKNTAFIWWQKQMELYIEEKVSEDILRKAAENLPERSETTELLRFCLREKIPVWIVSSGLGNVIKFWLKDRGFADDKIRILANWIYFTDKIPTGYGPVVTMWNKAEMLFRYLERSCEETLVFLGDREEDVGWRKENTVNYLIKNDKICLF